MKSATMRSRAADVERIKQIINNIEYNATGMMRFNAGTYWELEKLLFKHKDEKFYLIAAPFSSVYMGNTRAAPIVYHIMKIEKLLAREEVCAKYPEAILARPFSDGWQYVNSTRDLGSNVVEFKYSMDVYTYNEDLLRRSKNLVLLNKNILHVYEQFAAADVV